MSLQVIFSNGSSLWNKSMNSNTIRFLLLSTHVCHTPLLKALFAQITARKRLPKMYKYRLPIVKCFVLGLKTAALFTRSVLLFEHQSVTQTKRPHLKTKCNANQAKVNWRRFRCSLIQIRRCYDSKEMKHKLATFYNYLRNVKNFSLYLIIK